MTILSATDFGAAGDGVTMNTDAIEKAVAKLEKEGGGELVFPAGIFLAGHIRLVDNMTLRLEPGAVLRASGRIADYYLDTTLDLRKYSQHYYFLHGRGLRNVKICGPGIIEGNGHSFWQEEYYCGARFGELPTATSVLQYHVLKPKDERPALIYLADCTQITLEDLTIREAAAYTIWVNSCTDVLIRKIIVRNPSYGPNTDALDIDCSQNVVIENCDIKTGDDCVALKSDYHRVESNKSCENIIIRYCHFQSPTCALRIGYEGDGDIRNVQFTDTLIENTRHGIDVLSIVPVCPLRIEHGTTIERCRFANIRMRNVGQAFFIWAGNEPPHTEHSGHLEDFVFENMGIEAVGSSFIGCEKQGSIRKLIFRKIRMRVADLPNWAPTTDFSIMPSHWGSWIKAGGLHFHNVSDADFQDCEIKCEQPGFMPVEYSFSKI